MTRGRGGRLGDVLRRPVVAAPMAGGPSTVDLVVAVCDAGGLGTLAAGYRTAAAVQDQIEAVRARTADAFGVNVFVPGRPAADPAHLRHWLTALEAEAAAVGATLAEPHWDDDDWEAKVAVLLRTAPPLVTFTFGCPPVDVVRALQTAGSVVGVTVTEVGEAAAAARAGADCLIVQGTEAGAHRGTFVNDDAALTGQPLVQLLPAVVAVVDLPVVAAGGIMGSAATADALAAGATAVQCGTAFLRCPESGASALHKAALADGRRTTAVTRAFSGRPARALVNRFVSTHPDAPAAYPEVNNALRPLRAAAVAAGDAERASLWAGTGFAQATDRPAGEVIELLSP